MTNTLEEAVARIVDPSAWTAPNWVYDGLAERRKDSLEKARRILALPEIVKMQEALEPFAAEANSWDESIANDASVEVKAEGDDGCDVANFNVGDLRRAREAYAALQPLKKEAEYEPR